MGEGLGGAWRVEVSSGELVPLVTLHRVSGAAAQYDSSTLEVPHLSRNPGGCPALSRSGADLQWFPRSCTLSPEPGSFVAFGFPSPKCSILRRGEVGRSPGDDHIYCITVLSTLMLTCLSPKECRAVPSISCLLAISIRMAVLQIPYRLILCVSRFS